MVWKMPKFWFKKIQPSIIRVNSDRGAVDVSEPNRVKYRWVLIPDDVQPGEELQVYIDRCLMRTRCPMTARPGTFSLIEFPIPSATLIPGFDPPTYLLVVPEGIQTGERFRVTIEGRYFMMTCPENARPGSRVRIVPPLMQAPQPASLLLCYYPPECKVVIPEGTRPGQRFLVTIEGHLMMLICSAMCKPGDNVCFVLPRRLRRLLLPPPPPPKSFEVTVPHGVMPRQLFATLAGGVRVLATCPNNSSAGQKIQFDLPSNIDQEVNSTASNLAKIRIAYDKDGWMRTLRVADMKLQWIRVDEKGDVDINKRFHIDRSAYVGKLEFSTQGYDPRMRGGHLSLVNASEAVMDCKIKGIDDEEIVTCADITSVQMKSYEDKWDWIDLIFRKLDFKWNKGRDKHQNKLYMNFHPENLLSDSMEAIMCLSRNDLRRPWFIDFTGQEVFEGYNNEWFFLVTEEIFDIDMGLWQYSASNQMSLQINPASEISCGNDHLNYFRFLGIVMGKAIFCGNVVVGRMVRYIYKLIIGWPITFADLEELDEEYFNSLKVITAMDDVQTKCLNFSTTEETNGVKKTIDLIPNGSKITVHNDNLPEYLEACLKYRMLGRVKKQLNQLLSGIFDVIPEPLLTIFDFQEIQFLLCTYSQINMEDWMNNTEYSGKFKAVGPDHEVVKWFWKVVYSFDNEMKVRLLHFVNGTSEIPDKGFGALQNKDGTARRFTIHGVDPGVCIHPRAHSLYNRIDIPLYDSIKDMKERLTLAVTMFATGFDIK